jgi:broad specificity phosphatase PhoE
MGTLYLVRHGQASFGEADYDRLSPLGHRQCVKLGEYFRAKGIPSFDAVFTGTLKRHAESLAGIAEGLQWRPEPQRRPGLDEYDSGAIIAAIHPEPLTKPTTPELRRAHFRLLRRGIEQWMAGATQPRGLGTHAEFVAGVVAALDQVRSRHDGRVLIVSSGGPISTAVGHVLRMEMPATIELNLHIRNSAVTEFTFNPKRHTLLTFNTLPHLDTLDAAQWVTYA